MWDLEIGAPLTEEDLIDEMLGDSYLLGAARPMAMRRALTRRGVQRGGVPRQQLAAAVAARRAQTGVLVQEKQPMKGRALFMGLDSGAVNIAAAATANVTDRPQKLFRPERIAVPASIAPLFVLNDFRIGTTSQFVSNTAVPCETFQEGGVGVGLKGDTASPGIDITANVTNVSGGGARFRCTIYGSSVE